MQLAALQRCFKDAACGGNAAPLATFLDADSCDDITTRIEIYRNNVQQSLSNALQRIFPVCHRLMGEKHFLPAANGYLTVSDSTERDLNFYGAEFPSFLKQLCDEQPDFAKYTYVPDLARLEWLYHAVYYAEDDATFDFSGFEQASKERPDVLVLTLSHSLSLLPTRYPVLEIHQRFSGTNVSQQAVQVEAIAAADVFTRYICIYRQQWYPTRVYIDETMYNLIVALQGKLSLSKLVEQFPQLDRKLPELIKKGWINGFV